MNPCVTKQPVVCCALCRQGNLHDYDHVNMLTHRDVEKDHAPQILQWIKEHEQGANAKGSP